MANEINKDLLFAFITASHKLKGHSYAALGEHGHGHGHHGHHGHHGNLEGGKGRCPHRKTEDVSLAEASTGGCKHKRTDGPSVGLSKHNHEVVAEGAHKGCKHRGSQGPSHGLGHHNHGPKEDRCPVLPRERILLLLMEAESGLRQKDIVEAMHLSPATISEAIDKLVTDGFITKDTDEADKRATLIQLTETGKVRGNEIRAKGETVLGDLFQNLTEEEKEQLIKLLHKVIA